MHQQRIHVSGALWLVFALAASAAGACEAQRPIAPDIFVTTLGEPLPSATEAQRGTFERGLAVAKRRFTPNDGLGPHFNVTFCGACHEKPVFGGSGGRYRNFLLVGQALPDNSFVPTGINGVQAQFNLVEDARVATDQATNRIATRNPIPFFGVGLLAIVPESEILSRADPDDRNGDGISGRANFDGGFVGRFGRKAQSAAVEAFIRGPLFNHLGITSNPLPDARRAQLPVPSDNPESTVGVQQHSLVLPQVGAPDEPLEDDDSIPDPELDEDQLFDLVSFAMLLAPPQPDAPTPTTEMGRQLFEEIGCAACHVPALDSPRGLLPAYTDLLLHDMGPELDDGIRMELALTAEYRTAPLWGVVATAPYLHDGRADTLDEAIRWHGGEAAASRDAYSAKSAAEQDAIIGFLRSLGGADQATAGLLPPDAPVPAIGDYGGPIMALNADDEARFRLGRAVFDRDFAIAAGLGPLFNGDACRACHFDPVIGGAGPADVNVIRHAIVDPVDDTFVEPSIGTMAHRHSIAADERPGVDAAANLFEPRQTPPVFGLGLIDRIPADTILALADPDDADADGIRGRAHVLPDDRLGRFGWKAGVPSLAEFARDAMFNELGITLPSQDGLTFGKVEDDDDVTDPEIDLEELAALVFFMQSLGPPPRTSVNPEREDEGEIVFDDIGCARCHVPVLHTEDGTPVPLYSDLLLHDVAPAYFLGIEDGQASMREFRTPPLWGLATSAPYMHDGSAATVEAAILQHSGEAQAVRAAYLDLPPAQKAELAAFLESL